MGPNSVTEKALMMDIKVKFAFYTAFNDNVALVIAGESDSLMEFSSRLEQEIDNNVPLLFQSEHVSILIAAKTELDFRDGLMRVFIKKSNALSLVRICRGVAGNENPCHDFVDDPAMGFEIIVTKGEGGP